MSNHPSHLCIAIAFHFREEILRYINRSSDEFSKLAQRVSVHIMTNTSDANEKMAIAKAIAGKGFSFSIHTPTYLGHPFLLTWSHLGLFREQFDYDPSISHFLYLEDDVLFTAENMEYWMEGRQILGDSGFIPAFLRYETRPDEGERRYILDVMDYADPDKLPRINLTSGQYAFLGLPHFYQGMYLLDRAYMDLHLTTESSSPQDARWWIRERAADGINTYKVPNGFFSRNLVGYHVDRKQIDFRCLIHHMSNRYTYTTESRCGKIPVESVIRVSA